MTTFTIHPICELLPELDGEEFEAFVADIKKNGQRVSITIDRQNRVIDGRNRLRACERLGIEPRARLFKDDERDIPAYVMSKNVYRRHFTASQRAMVAAKLADMPHGGSEVRSKCKFASWYPTPVRPVAGGRAAFRGTSTARVIGCHGFTLS